jgi:hypothetical protein
MIYLPGFIKSGSGIQTLMGMDSKTQISCRSQKLTSGTYVDSRQGVVLQFGGKAWG